MLTYSGNTDRIGESIDQNALSRESGRSDDHVLDIIPEKTSTRRVFYVDYENTNEKRLEGCESLSADDVVKIFYRSTQSIKLATLQTIFESGAGLELFKNEIKHDQAADIQILLEINRLRKEASRSHIVHHIIVSADKGFADDILDLQQKGVCIEQYINIGNIESKPLGTEEQEQDDTGQEKLQAALPSANDLSDNKNTGSGDRQTLVAALRVALTELLRNGYNKLLSSRDKADLIDEFACNYSNNDLMLKKLREYKFTAPQAKPLIGFVKKTVTAFPDAADQKTNMTGIANDSAKTSAQQKTKAGASASTIQTQDSNTSGQQRPINDAAQKCAEKYFKNNYTKILSSKTRADITGEFACRFSEKGYLVNRLIQCGLTIQQANSVYTTINNNLKKADNSNCGSKEKAVISNLLQNNYKKIITDKNRSVLINEFAAHYKETDYMTQVLKKQGFDKGQIIPLMGLVRNALKQAQ